MSTKFSTKGPNSGGLGLYDLSKFLSERNGYLNISSGEDFISLEFTKISDILDAESINIERQKLDNQIKGTYISFTFST